MLIQDMSKEMNVKLLKGVHFGRIACARDSQPYITPFSFVHHGGYLYSFANVGKRIEWMRANPLVCVEVEDIVTRREWRTVVIFGKYQELPDTAQVSELIYFRISIDEMSGRQAIAA